MANKDVGRTGSQPDAANRKGGPKEMGDDPTRGDAGEDIRGVGDEDLEDEFEDTDDEEDEDEDEPGAM